MFAIMSGDVAAQREAGSFIQAAPGSFLVLPAGGGAVRPAGAVERSPYLCSATRQASGPGTARCSRRLGPVLAGEHPHDVHLILNRAYSNPLHAVVFLRPLKYDPVRA